MGISSDGILCFGFSLPEEVELPWDTEEDDDIENWWIDVIHGYKPPFELYDGHGDYLKGVEPPQERIDEYYNHRRAFEKTLPPLPVEVVHHCSYDYPMYIIAVPGTKLRAYRGYPQRVETSFAEVSEEQVAAVREFCEKYNVPIGDELPGWWLASMYG